MNECVRRWKENQPLTAAEWNGMRLQLVLRIIVALLLAGLALFFCAGCAKNLQAQSFPAREVPEAEQTFDGVTIVVAVKGLTEFAPDIRAKMATEADRVLRDLAERKLPGKVRTRLVAEVAEPYSFQNIEAASMQVARPVLVHVLVPRRNAGLTVGVILKRVEDLAQSHFLESLQRHHVLVTFERLNPEHYQAAMMAASLQEPPAEAKPVSAPEPGQPIPVPPLPVSEEPSRSESGLILTMLVAWLTERSKLAAKLLAAYQHYRGDPA